MFMLEMNIKINMLVLNLISDSDDTVEIEIIKSIWLVNLMSYTSLNKFYLPGLATKETG